MISQDKINASIVSGVVEVVTTHPIDYIKTLIQNSNNKINLTQIKTYMMTPYKGVSSRLIGVVPMRMLFWNSLDFFQRKGYSPIYSGLITSIIQTSVDYPIEQIKTQQINNNNYNVLKCFSHVKIFPSLGFHLLRNAGFAIIINDIIQRKPESIYYGAIGGFTASLLTHPFDSLKTWYMSGNKSFPIKWTFENYMRGWYYRSGVSLISMNIGWIIYYRLSK